MCVGKQTTLTFTLALAPLLLLLGCSSHTGSNKLDADRVTEAGATADARDSDASDTRKTDGGVVDSRNSDSGATEDGISEAGTKVDARDAARTNDGRDAPSTIDSDPDRGSADGGVIVDAGDEAVDAVNDDVPPVSGGTCASPIPIPFTSMRANILTTNVGAAHQVNIPCAKNGADMIFSITVTSPQVVYADTFGASWNTILLFSDSCPPRATLPVTNPGLSMCNDDACGSSQSQATALITLGTYYLILSGANGESGDVTIHLDRSVTGYGALSPFPAGLGSLTGTTSGDSGTSICEADGPEDTYWWTTCPDFAGGAFSAATCPGTTFKSLLVEQVPRGAISSCNGNEDSCATVAVALPPGAGLQTLSIFGNVPNSFGKYTLTYTRP
jgi:hypothetical protein